MTEYAEIFRDSHGNLTYRVLDGDARWEEMRASGEIMTHASGLEAIMQRCADRGPRQYWEEDDLEMARRRAGRWNL
jgi:hypothetical protein